MEVGVDTGSEGVGLNWWLRAVSVGCWLVKCVRPGAVSVGCWLVKCVRPGVVSVGCWLLKCVRPGCWLVKCVRPGVVSVGCWLVKCVRPGVVSVGCWLVKCVRPGVGAVGGGLEGVKVGLEKVGLCVRLECVGTDAEVCGMCTGGGLLKVEFGGGIVEVEVATWFVEIRVCGMLVEEGHGCVFMDVGNCCRSTGVTSGSGVESIEAGGWSRGLENGKALLEVDVEGGWAAGGGVERGQLAGRMELIISGGGLDRRGGCGREERGGELGNGVERSVSNGETKHSGLEGDKVSFATPGGAVRLDIGARPQRCVCAGRKAGVGGCLKGVVVGGCLE